jgi:hypothetical protein
VSSYPSQAPSSLVKSAIVAHLCRVGASDLLEDDLCFAEILDSPAGFAKVLVSDTEIAKRIALAAPVADLPRGHELPLVQLDGAAGLTAVPGHDDVAPCASSD